MNAENKIVESLATAISATHGNQPTGFIAEDAPFDPAQRLWLNGLLSGLHAIAASANAAPAQEAESTALTILYGSQSGNSEALAKTLRKSAKTKGFDATVKALDDVTLDEIAQLQHMLIIAATFGEGEPTDNAVKFHAALMDEGAAALPASLNFSVLGLGDSSYPDFNQTAREFDRRLGELGATRAADAIFCDVDFDDDYAAWSETVFASDPFKNAAGAASAPEPVTDAPAFDKNHPFMATLTVAERLSGDESAKCVNHVELSLAGGGKDLDYEVGDALGVWPMNCPDEVKAILQATGLTGKETIMLKTGPAALRAALLTRLDIQTVTPKTLESWACEKQSDDDHLIDLIEAGLDLDPQALVDGMRPLQPRLYSISSSPKAHPGEVHLTVGEVRYKMRDSDRKGVASTFLGARVTEGASVGVYVQKSGHFHIPADDDLPLIMIGPGTGIAPFRAFLEEREARGAAGKNWLFFGDQHEACDYLYRDQIEDWSEQGVLDKVSLAWSRDSSEKVYVQTLLEKDGVEVFDWLESGAAIYICGDASRMASDVDRTLRDIIAKHGDMSSDDADAYVDMLISSHRYQRDVY